MSKNSAIQIILRVRPAKEVFSGFSMNKEEQKVQFFIPKEEDAGFINNNKEKRTFKFDQLFDMEARQEKIFDKVAKDVVDSALEGFNGTIFAYGQTGSGKTFTMTGGGDHIDDRGIIPRVLGYIFQCCKEKAESIRVTISYLQIYNQFGYDLLTDQTTTKLVTDLPRIKPREGANGELKLQNLSAYHANSEEDAMNFLYLGDTTRVVCKTPKNDESTRSHCIFIINIESMKPGSDIKTNATIHLVDLSGSERIKQTGVTGKLEEEAIAINLGLHYLERVIVELNKKARGQNVHVPYRESLMTMILRDSIGGNCKTRMIATMSAKQEDIMESIATCKFAMRVALIKNDLLRNQSVDPAVIIARLKNQNRQLKAELALLKGGEVKEELDKYQIQQCHKTVDDYLQSEDPAETIIFTDRLKLNQCFYYFKNLFKKGGKTVLEEKKFLSENNENKRLQKSFVNNEEDNFRANDEIKRLKLLLQQRQNEIALMVTLISKRSSNNEGSINIPVRRDKEEENMLKSIVKDKPIVFPSEEEVRKSIIQGDPNDREIERPKKHYNNFLNENHSAGQNSTVRRAITSNITNIEQEEIEKMLIQPLNLTAEQILDHAQAFEQFRRSYRKTEAMESNKAILQEKMNKGKEIGKITNQIREKISDLKKRLEDLKRENAVNSLVEGKEYDDPEQQRIRDEINSLKQKSKPYVNELKSIKAEIESIQILQRNQMEKLKKDFERYILFMQSQRSQMAQHIDSSLLASSIRDKEVSKHLESFMKAREEIRKR